MEKFKIEIRIGKMPVIKPACRFSNMDAAEVYALSLRKTTKRKTQVRINVI